MVNPLEDRNEKGRCRTQKGRLPFFPQEKESGISRAVFITGGQALAYPGNEGLPALKVMPDWKCEGKLFHLRFADFLVRRPGGLRSQVEAP